jgi:mannose-6-phosphate isomerase-like protein (cupin superfamily)
MSRWATVRAATGAMVGRARDGTALAAGPVATSGLPSRGGAGEGPLARTPACDAFPPHVHGYEPVVADVTQRKISEIEAIEGFFEGIKFHKAGAGLGVSSFGISITDLAPGADEYPEHDHSDEGIGGRMFAKRPQQLGQEEVYIALRGSGTLEADGERYPIDADHIVRVGPTVKRKVVPGPDGLRLLALGGTPGEAYDAGGSL